MFWLTTPFGVQWLKIGMSDVEWLESGYYHPRDGITYGTRVTSTEAVGTGPWIIVHDPPTDLGWLDGQD